MRKLSVKFMGDLVNSDGVLHPILTRVKKDHTITVHSLKLIGVFRILLMPKLRFCDEIPYPEMQFSKNRRKHTDHSTKYTLLLIPKTVLCTELADRLYL